MTWPFQRPQEIARRVLMPSAGQNDKAGRFPTEAVVALGESGLLGLMIPVDLGGLGLGPRTLAAVIEALAETDASVAMVYLMHILGTAAISASRPGATQAVEPSWKKSPQGGTYPPWLSVRPGRAAISGRLYRAHTGMATACGSALRNRG